MKGDSRRACVQDSKRDDIHRCASSFSLDDSGTAFARRRTNAFCALQERAGSSDYLTQTFPALNKSSEARGSLMGRSFRLTRSNGGLLQPRRQPANDAASQTRRADNAVLPMWQPPDVGLLPQLPEFLNGFPWLHEIMDAFDQ